MIKIYLLTVLCILHIYGISQIVDLKIPKKVTYITTEDTVGPVSNLFDEFKAIGWSKTGNFAYIVEPADEACGCYFFEIHIINTNNNKSIWSWKYSDENAADKRSMATIDTVWKLHKKMLIKKLNEAGIVQQQQIVLIPKQTLQKTKSIQLNEVQTMFESVDYGTMLKDYKLYAKEKNIKYPNKLGKQIFYKKFATWEKDRKVWFSYWMQANAIGAIKSPYSNQYLLLHKILQRGWEGTPYVIKLEVSGLKIK
jgi:hypothetical protein